MGRFVLPAFCGFAGEIANVQVGSRLLCIIACPNCPCYIAAVPDGSSTSFTSTALLSCSAGGRLPLALRQHHPAGSALSAPRGWVLVASQGTDWVSLRQ